MTAVNETTTPEDILVRNAAIRGMIEIMLSPEVGSGWLFELMGEMTKDKSLVVTEEMSEQADELMSKMFRAMVTNLAPTMDEEYRKSFYTDY